MKYLLWCFAAALLLSVAAHADNSCSTPGDGSHAENLGGKECTGKCDLCMSIAPNDIDLKNGATQNFVLRYRLSVPGDHVLQGNPSIDWGDGSPLQQLAQGATSIDHTFNQCADKCTYTVHAVVTMDFQYTGDGSCSYRCSAHQTAVVRISQPDPPPAIENPVVPSVKNPVEQPDPRNNPVDGSGSTKAPSPGLPIDKLLAFIFGAVFVIVLLVVARFDRNPPPFSKFIYRVVMSLAAAGIGAVIPGIIDVSINPLVRAGGALALFVLVYMVNPPDQIPPK